MWFDTILQTCSDLFKIETWWCSRQKLNKKQKQVTCFTLKCLKKELIERFWIRFESCCFKQDSKELSPRSLDNMHLKAQVNSQNVQNKIWIVTIHMIFKHV